MLESSKQMSWLAAEIDGLTDELKLLSPEEWAEENRYLPPSCSSIPGPYSYDVAPYLREIVNCLDVRSPVRKVVAMKGTQICATVGIAENAIGYFISQIKTAPIMFVTADQGLAQLRMEECITPMIEQSGLSELIQANTENKRKAGMTDKKVSWYGGGFLIPIGSREASKLRSISVRALILDEMDAYPLRVGRDGDPSALAVRRTSAYAKNRKILCISTPTTEEESRIAVEYAEGDRRKYEVPCVGCGEFQELRWRVDDKKGEQIGGIVWDEKGGRVTPGSVRYACHHCGFCHINEHKRKMLPQGRWRATAIPSHPSVRSYHISGLMSPADFYSWEDAVKDWLAAWCTKTKRAKNVEKLQEFYNNTLGQTFRVGGVKLTFAKVGKHAREYDFGRVPNDLAMKLSGGKVGFLTCQVDVQKTFLSVSVKAWAPNRIGFLIDYRKFEGDTSDPLDPKGPWGDLSTLIEQKRYPDGEGRSYGLQITLVDSGHFTSEVYTFCSRYSSGVYPVKGDEKVVGGPAREFAKMKDASTSGVTGWIVNVNLYKTRLAHLLARAPANEAAPVDSVSFPGTISDEALKELVAEEFIEEVNKRTGVRKWIWKRKAARNELWDLTVYASAARDIYAYQICREHFEFEGIDWAAFWPWLEDSKIGWTEDDT